MKVTEEQHKFMMQLIKQLEESNVDEIVFDMNIQGKSGNYVFKYAMLKAAASAN